MVWESFTFTALIAAAALSILRFGPERNPALNNLKVTRPEDPVDVSIVVPIYNELENVPILLGEITAVMQAGPYSWELICVDDGSTDGTAEALAQAANSQPEVKLVRLRRNFGQTAAMQAGIQHASGNVVVTMDGDLQNDPRDIPAMLEKIDQGADLVLGWRRQRQDRLFSRKIPSRIANWLISRTTGVAVHDLGCTLKAIRADLARNLELYGEMHRFIPVLAHRLGARTVEMETHHRPRQFGTTKYGIGRTTRVVLDLLTVQFLLKYFDSPMKLFGKMGLIVGALSWLCFSAAGIMKVLGGVDLTGNPLLILSVLGTILSVQFFGLGFLGEVNARIYFAANGKQNYQVRELVNFGPGSSGPRRRAA